MFGKHLAIVALLGLLIATPLLAEPLEAGADAPPLKVKKWIKGEKFKLEDVKNREIVVLYFFVTNGQISRAALSKVNEVQERFENDLVRTVGLTPEDTSTVMNFCHSMGKRVGITVAVDTDGKTYESIFEQQDTQNLPRIVIVDRKGKIAWIGHPLDDDYEEELELLVLKQPAPENKKLKEAHRLQKEYYTLAQTEGASKEELGKIGRQMIKLGAKDKAFLIDVTNMIVKSKKIKTRDLATAKKAVEAACELTENKDCKVIELHARVVYEMGDLKEALKLLRDAIRVCEDFDHEDTLEQRIEALRKKLDSGA